jgi:hypothetical protein
LLNDDYTTMEFVIQVLQQFFDKDIWIIFFKRLINKA